MVTFLVISNIAQWTLILFVVANKLPMRIEFKWNRTFFGKVRYGFEFLLWRRTGPNSAIAHRILSFNWANKDSIKDKPDYRPDRLWARPSFLRRKLRA